MSTENHDTGNEPDRAFSLEQQEIINGLLAKAKQDAIEIARAEISGLNRKTNELDRAVKEKDAELERLKTEKLSEEERFKLELDKRDQALTARERELVVTSNREKALKYATENSLPLEFIDFVPMSDETVMMDSLTKVKAVVDGDRASVLEALKKNGGDKPGAGGAKGKPSPKKKSEMTISEANAYAAEHGSDAFKALPE